MAKLSEQAKEVIRQMKAGWNDRKAPDPNKDPRLAALEAVYAERAHVDNPAVPHFVPDRISVVPQMADGVYGEWLRYLDEAEDKLRERVILFLHGGGFQTGSCLSRRELASNIGVRAKMDTFIINYRLAPENPHPAALEDCVTAFIWLLKQGYKPENVTIVGESAGANLALCTCHFLRDHYLPLPGRIVPFSPPADLGRVFESRVYNLTKDAMMGRNATEEELEAMMKEVKEGVADRGLSFYATGEQTLSPYVSPIRGSFAGFPKTLIEVGEYEILYDDSVMLTEKMKAEGVDVTLHVWEELFHVFALLPMPEADEVCQEIADFARG